VISKKIKGNISVMSAKYNPLAINTIGLIKNANKRLTKIVTMSVSAGFKPKYKLSNAAVYPPIPT
jgi:hypothetical protein